MFFIYAIIIFFSIFNSTTNCARVSCQNNGDCQVLAKLHSLCIKPGEYAACISPNLECACIKPQNPPTVHNISGL
ncbi:hypothetical protein P8452_54818 [Trifolium repens]|nr:hypothetical protein P8452_54818 [Trifolium repens]